MTDEHTHRMAKSIEIVRGPGEHADLFIDGELFPYYTRDGFTVGSIMKAEAPAVTLTIVAEVVNVRDSYLGKSEAESDGAD